jgi:hypothetical protein
MEDLIKVASNGQWILEKAKPTSADAQRMIEEFLARKNAKTTAKPATPVAPKSTYPEGMRPAQLSTGNNPAMDKEKVAAFRAAIEQGLPAPKLTPSPKFSPTPEGAASADKMATLQSQDDEKAKTTAARKQAWEATAAFLAEKGVKGYQALQQHMQQQKKLEGAAQGKVEPKKELMPPQELHRDAATGATSMRVREGTFHNQGATTRGKIVNRQVRYKDKATGEDRFTNHPQVEQHVWSWDHPNKKWNHVKTTYAPASK